MPSYPLVAVENSGGQRRTPSLPRCCPLPSIPPSPHVLSPHPSFPTIPTSCCFHSVATWRWWRSMGCVRRVGGLVTWRRRWASLAAGDVALSGVVVGVFVGIVVGVVVGVIGGQ